ncbi:MAG: adenosylcobinamide-GDP ribazoletransferase [Methylophilaceae bacterium]|jgi:adenosylcobinamide-GDP ribazoletransferase|nr:adenosylcobinamide-GDP ribazoletransferase [Methylophilaceae bacterium]MDG1454343.1 adenosylcobinamide-GDP ribazoletransferase [Methylophilaceae bacterium]
MLVKEWRYFLLALGFFTRIPVPQFANFQEDDLNHSAKYFPLIGVIVGLCGAAAFMISAIFLPQHIAVLISMATTIYLTGAFHEDGLADSADGFGGGWQREQILTIMQDSRLGTYGAAALFFILFSKFQLLNVLSADLIPLVLIAAHAISRLAAVWVMATLPYAKPVGKAKPLATHISGRALWLANLLGLLPYLGIIGLLLLNHPVILVVKLVALTLAPMLLAWLWWRKKMNRWLNGYTGDALGAMQQITELAFYLGLVLWSVNA